MQSTHRIPNVTDIIANTLTLKGHTGTPTPQVEPVVLRELQTRDNHTFTGVTDLVVLPLVNTEGPPRLLVLTRANTTSNLVVSRVIHLAEDLAANYSWCRVLGARVTSGSNLSVVGDRSFSGVVRYAVYHSLPDYSKLSSDITSSIELARSPDLPYGTSVSMLTPPPTPAKSTTRQPVLRATAPTYIGAAPTSDTLPGGVSERRQLGHPESYLFESRNQPASTAFPWATDSSSTLSASPGSFAIIADIDILASEMVENPITSASVIVNLPRFNVVNANTFTGVVMLELEYLCDGISLPPFPLASVLEFSGVVAGSYGFGGGTFVAPRQSFVQPISGVRVVLRNSTTQSVQFVRPNATGQNYQAVEILDYSREFPIQAIVYEGLDASLTHNLYHELKCLLELSPNPSLAKLVTPVNYTHPTLNYDSFVQKFKTPVALSLMGGREAFEKSRASELVEKVGYSGVYDMAGTALGLAADYLAPEFASGLKRGLCAVDDPPGSPEPAPAPEPEHEPASVPGHVEGKVGLCMDQSDGGGIDIPLEFLTGATTPAAARVPNLASNAEDPALRRVTDSLVRGDRKATVRALYDERGYYHTSNRFAYLVDGKGVVGSIALSNVVPRGEYQGTPVATVDSNGLRTVIHAPPIFANFANQMKRMVEGLRPPAGTQSLTNAPDLYVQVYAPGVASLEQDSWQLAFAACLAALPVAAVLAGRVEDDGAVVAKLSGANALEKLKAANALGLPLLTSAEQFKSGPKSPGPDLVLLRDHDVTPVAMGLANINMLVIYAMIANAPKPVVKKETNVLLGGVPSVLPAGTIMPSAAKPVPAAQNTPQTISSEPLELEIPDVFRGVIGASTVTIDGPSALKTVVDKVASIKGNRGPDGQPIWRPTYDKFFKKYPYNNATGGDPVPKSSDPSERRIDSYIMRPSLGTADGESLPSLQIAINSIASQTAARARKGTTPQAVPKARAAAAGRLQNVMFEDDELFG